MKTEITPTRRSVVAIAAAIATAAALVYAVWTPFASSAQREKPQRIHLVEREVSVHNINIGPKSFGPGDRHLIRSTILNTHGRAIGRADFECTVTDGGRGLGGICLASLRLPGGQVVGQFSFGLGKAGSPSRQAITGGTGRYEGAHGQFIIGRETSAKTPFVIELVR